MIFGANFTEMYDDDALVVLDRGWSCFYDSGQLGGRQEDSTSLRERLGTAGGQ